MFPFPLALLMLAYVCAVSVLLVIAINAEMSHCGANLNTVSQEGKLFLRFYVGAKRNRTRNRVEKTCLLLDALFDRFELPMPQHETFKKFASIAHAAGRNVA
jgi:hypothetical protein